MKDQEEFEQLRLSSCHDINTVINQRIKQARDLKKIKKEVMKNMIESPLIFLQHAAAHQQDKQSPKGQDAGAAQTLQ